MLGEAVRVTVRGQICGMTSLAISVSLPLVLALAQARLPGTAGLGDIGLGMAQVTVLPIAAGMALRATRPEWAARLRTGAEPLGKTIFAILVLGTFVQNRAVMQEHFVELGAPVVMLNLGALVLGGGIPALAGVDAVSARAIMVEASLQNVAVTIFVASTLMGRPDLAVPGLLYAVVMNVTALILIGAARRFRHPVL